MATEEATLHARITKLNEQIASQFGLPATIWTTDDNPMRFELVGADGEVMFERLTLDGMVRLLRIDEEDN